MANLVVKANDTYPPITAVLSDANGPINLTTATTVMFIMKSSTGVMVSGTCTITSPTAGQVQYLWATSDLAVIGQYEVEFEIHWSGGGIQTVPNAETANPTIEVDRDLNTVGSS